MASGGLGKLTTDSPNQNLSSANAKNVLFLNEKKLMITIKMSVSSVCVWNSQTAKPSASVLTVYFATYS